MQVIFLVQDTVSVSLKHQKGNAEIFLCRIEFPITSVLKLIYYTAHVITIKKHNLFFKNNIK